MVLIEKLRSAITVPSGWVTNGWTKIPGIPSNICSDILSKQQSADIYLLLVFCYYYPLQSCFAVVWYQKSNNPGLQKLWMCQGDFCKLSHLRNVQQELEDQGSPHLSSTGIQPTKTCAGLHPLICHPSIHLSGCGRPSITNIRELLSGWLFSYDSPCQSVQGPHCALECSTSSILVVDKVKSTGASHQSPLWDRVSALLSYCCGTPREMLSHTSSGNKGPGWGWGWRRWGLPVPQTLLLSPFRAPQTSGGSFTLSSIQTKPAFSENKASHCVSAWLVQTLIIMTIMKYFNQGLDVCGSSLMYLASGKSSRAVICRINERLYKMHCKV